MVVEGKKCQFSACAITLKLVEGHAFFYYLSLCDTVEIKKKKELIV